MTYSGGYCSGVPPLPSPNREVKPACADGTAMQCGRVGGRPLFLKRKALERNLRGFFCLIILVEVYLGQRISGANDAGGGDFDAGLFAVIEETGGEAAIFI